MRASRLLSILMLLQLRGRVSAAALARELEVTVRTIYRDVEQLSAAGVPIYATRGRDGGFALLAGYQTRLTGLDAGEADLIGLMDVADAARALGFDREPAALRQKLLASLPATEGAAAARIAARFHLDPVPWYGQRPTPACLPALAAAAWTDREIDIEYESWRGVVRRAVLPLGLVAKAGEWYCLALAAGDVRIYKVAAIRALVVSDRVGRRPAAFDLTACWAERVAAFERDLHAQVARVRLSADGLRLLRDLQPGAYAHASTRLSPPDAAGWVETDVPYEAGLHGVRELLRFGAEIEVLAPAELRQALAAEAARVQARYGAPAAPTRRRRRAQP